MNNIVKYIGILPLSLFALFSQGVMAQEAAEADTINVAFRQSDARDVIVPVSTVNVKDFFAFLLAQLVTVIFVVPGFIALMMPFSLTVATLFLELLNFRFLLDAFAGLKDMLSFLLSLANIFFGGLFT